LTVDFIVNRYQKTEMINKKIKKEIKDGGIFYRDVHAMHERAMQVLIRVKKKEASGEKRIPVYINRRITVLVPIGTNIQEIKNKYKSRSLNVYQ
jgi:hypothetical protein